MLIHEKTKVNIMMKAFVYSTMVQYSTVQWYSTVQYNGTVQWYSTMVQYSTVQYNVDIFSSLLCS